LQTLYFKFSASPESVYIFSAIGMEPWGRIATGIVELVASICLFINRLVLPGAILAAGTMCGAIFFHLTKLGIEVQGDGGLLFFYALTVLICSLVLMLLYRKNLLSRRSS
ncbi:MAG: DoxX family protein, partial [Pedobacter sp.]